MNLLRTYLSISLLKKLIKRSDDLLTNHTIKSWIYYLFSIL